MIDKRCASLADAVADCPDLRDGATLLIGGFGLFFEAARWLLIIAVVLFIISAVTGMRGRGRV